MNVLIVLAHPERASFNGGLSDVAADALQAQGHQVEVDDLYRQGFDPVERASFYTRREDETHFATLTEQREHYDDNALPRDVQHELNRLDWADLVIFQFPLWWHAQPAILKGWFDRVLVYGGRYSGSMRYDHGYFRGKRAVLSVTTGSPRQAFQPLGRAGNMVEWLWPMHASLYYVGFDVLAPQVSYGIQGGGIRYQDASAFHDQLERQKDHWRTRVPGLYQEASIPFTGWDDWDADGMLADHNPLRWRP
ncbi:NAD(P)H dehydrogenase (quinone) [Tamilnaduibacter salinus]|uniref:NAD(P)H dehydrogenase (Quinone) n=1 Tax=Tamilnaduibacter salinus TaxID=1484056 RepID=A0A2U1CTL4_9GAMM|nr:NAD(P)H-dependent oxidoreductase [Tamilnaduibacter salinus]PVY70041.1 NAD(P)H dehydrogenase (quinone) [Tamilnaduibacter salinus]